MEKKKKILRGNLVSKCDLKSRVARGRGVELEEFKVLIFNNKNIIIIINYHELR